MMVRTVMMVLLDNDGDDDDGDDDDCDAEYGKVD